jgi:hypothetical protein
MGQGRHSVNPREGSSVADEQSRADRLPDQQPRLLSEAPEGTILPTSEPVVFFVKGRTDWYRCNADRSECSCPDYRFRRTREPGLCRHLRHLTDYLMSKEPALTPTGKVLPPGLMSMTIKPEFLVQLKGSAFPLFAGVLDAATQVGLRSLCTTIIQLPSPENGHMAVVMARAEFADGRVFEDVGDASPLNTSSQIASAVLRLASTRAAGRALRWAINCGATLLEELPDHERKAASSSTPPSSRSRPLAAATPAAATRSASVFRPLAAVVAGDDRPVDPAAGLVGAADRTPPEVAPPAKEPAVVCSWNGCQALLTSGQVTISRRYYDGHLLCPTHQRAMKGRRCADDKQY